MVDAANESSLDRSVDGPVDAGQAVRELLG
jgi:hypothetical protein